VKGFSFLAKPLFALTKNGTEFVWEEIKVLSIN